MTSQLLWGEEAVYGWLGPLPRHSQGCSQNASWLTLSGEGLTGKTGSRPELTPVRSGVTARKSPPGGGHLALTAAGGDRRIRGYFH